MLKKHFDGLGFRKDARDDPKKEKAATRRATRMTMVSLPSTTAT